MTGRAESFRTDINALRAVAVLSVTFFHFGVPGVEGGFVGVDVFFVISGFLMTKVMLSRMQNGEFYYSAFVWSRILRIYPPMLCLLTVLSALGYRFLVPGDYEALARRTVSAVLSASNIYFYRESFDYFAPSQRSNYLLHLWSLSAEIQFYLTFPLLLGCAAKFRRPWVILGAMLAVSLAACIAITFTNPSGAFYLLPFRVWEFLAGGLACLLLPLTPRPRRVPLSAAGFLLIAIGVLTFKETMQFPGYAAVLPVLGTALVVAAPTDGPLVRSTAVQFLGSISYSLYLWHWPVWVGAQQFGVTPSLTHSGGLILLSIVLGAASHWIIERPVAQVRHTMGRRPVLTTAAVTASLTLVLGTASLTAYEGGWPDRVPELIRNVIPRFHRDLQTRVRSPVCFVTLTQDVDRFAPRCFEASEPNPGGRKVFLWGDSLAAHLWMGFTSLPATQNMTLLGATAAACPPDLAAGPLTTLCERVNAKAMTEIRRTNPDNVILFADPSWSAKVLAAPDKLEGLLKALTATGTDVLVVGPIPIWPPTLPQRLLQESLLTGVIPDRLRDPGQETGRALDRGMARAVARAGARYLSLYDILCTDEGCQTTVQTGSGRELIVYDLAHPTVRASETVVSHILVRALLGPLQTERERRAATSPDR